MKHSNTKVVYIISRRPVLTCNYVMRSSSSRQLGYYSISVVRGVAFFEIEIGTEEIIPIQF